MGSRGWGSGGGVAGNRRQIISESTTLVNLIAMLNIQNTVPTHLLKRV